MKPDHIVEAARWLQQAQEDLDDARYLAAGRRHSAACFFSQQAGEKALKSYLYFREVEVVWGHSVAQLSRDAGHFDAAFREWERKGSLLDRYYLPTRYPDAMPGGLPKDAFDETDSERALKLASALIDLVAARLA